MKNIIIYIASLLFISLGLNDKLEAKEGNLLVIIDGMEANRLVLEYPNGTIYKVLNNSNLPVESMQEKEAILYRTGNYQLIIYPTYKESPDTFEIENQQIKILKSVDYSNPIKFHQQIGSTITNDYGQYIGDVKMDKLLVRSKQFPKEYNCVVTLSNGTVFSYINGEAAATLYDQILKIKGKYIFESKLGTTKLSYNPKDGQVWYIFEPKNGEE